MATWLCANPNRTVIIRPTDPRNPVCDIVMTTYRQSDATLEFILVELKDRRHTRRDEISVKLFELMKNVNVAALNDARPKAQFGAKKQPAAAPRAQVPDTPVADMSAAETSARDTMVPDTTAPSATAPTKTAPKTTALKTTAPKTTAPKTTALKTTAPKTTAPKTTAPKTTAPKTTVPNTTDSDVAGNSSPGAVVPRRRGSAKPVKLELSVFHKICELVGVGVKPRVQLIIAGRCEETYAVLQGTIENVIDEKTRSTSDPEAEKQSAD